MSIDMNSFPNTGAAPFLNRLRKGMLLGGIVMILLGIAAIMMPLLSSLVIEIMIGSLLTASGALAITWSFSLRGTGLFAWELAVGLITLAGGLVMLFFPLEGLVALTVLVALVMLLTGFAQGSFALWARPARGWIWGAISAAISIALGIFILVALPEASRVILGLLLGIDFVSTGTALVLLSRSAAVL
jgi:uncharacterized membrane protein HdeD (DUF308 family)